MMSESNMTVVRIKKSLILAIALGILTFIGILAGWRITSQRNYGHRKAEMSLSENDPVEGEESVSQSLFAKAGCVKHVHIFGSDREMRHIPELHRYMDLFQRSNQPLDAADVDCVSEGYDCDIVLTRGGNVDYLEGKDVIVFGLVPTEFRGEGREQLKRLMEWEPSPGQTWIYFSTETPLRVLKWTRDFDVMRLKYHLLMTYDLDSDIVVPFGYYRSFDESTEALNVSSKQALETRRLPDPLLGKEGMVSWMSSNCHGFWPRVEFIKRMRDVLPLEDYGLCGRKECLPRRSDECNKLMARYKFYFAIPNSECKDYITEKFWLQSLSYGTVPIVLGSKKESYEAVAPPNSYIHFSDYDSVGNFVAFLKRLDKDDEAYRKFYDWRTKGEVVLTFPTRPTIFCKALPHLQDKRDVKAYKYLNDSPWFKGCRVTPNNKVFDMSREETRNFFKFENWSIWR
ncbi:alpha-(1,3)-fucosyltransferase 7-like [Lytechinus pictus]|uniref:alpha-(1,3)-fucosyltransferase 7-like n=1 Tax=Lytechinus pictus TaxID=7653 RepID=UPI0030B9EB8D